MDNKDLICKILLVIIIGITVWQIIGFFNRETTVIEETGIAAPLPKFREGLEGTSINNTPTAPKCNCVYDPNRDNAPIGNIDFYLRDNRFATCKKGDCTGYTMPGPSENLCNLNLPGCWDVPHKAGANNTCSDLLWHKMEPRMILQDIGMKCTDCGPQTNYNSPSGVASDLTSNLTGNHEKAGAIQSNTGFGGLNPVETNRHMPTRHLNGHCTGQPALPQPSCLDSVIQKQPCNCGVPIGNTVEICEKQ